MEVYLPIPNHFPGEASAAQYLARGVQARNTRRLPDLRSAFRRQQIDVQSQGRVESCGRMRRQTSKPKELNNASCFLVFILYTYFITQNIAILQVLRLGNLIAFHNATVFCNKESVTSKKQMSKQANDFCNELSHVLYRFHRESMTQKHLTHRSR